MLFFTLRIIICDYTMVQVRVRTTEEPNGGAMDKKGGIFVLYNYARMTNLLNKFDDAVASGELWFYGCVSHRGLINKFTKI